MLAKRKSSLLLLIAFALFAFSSPELNNQMGNEPWKAPKEADDLKNPLVDNKSSLIAGKKLFKQMCSVCHGVKGKGDGIAGSALNPKPTNFTLPNVQGQSDGAIYWKISEGRSPMASYKGMLKEEQRWQLVNYIRTFKNQ